MMEPYNAELDESFRWTQGKTARDDGGPDVYRCDGCGALLGYSDLEDTETTEGVANTDRQAPRW